MPIYHLSAKVISRARGQSVVAAAAYRSGTALGDRRYGGTRRYAASPAVAHAEIMAADGTPPWVRDREVLWNRVEEGERRKDAQLARLIEVALPIELSLAECVALLRGFVASEFVARGMVADFCIRGGAHHPHAHIMLTLRPVTASGFGPKERRWNGKAMLYRWRAVWADRVNIELAAAGHHGRVDHRTLEAQNIELIPGRYVGVSRERHDDPELPRHLGERVLEHRQALEANGAAICEDPTVLLRALTHQYPIFTLPQMRAFLRARTAGPAQYAAAYARVSECPDLVALDPSDGKEARFTSRDMLEAEESLLRRVRAMAARRARPPAVDGPAAERVRDPLDATARRALDYLLAEGDAKACLLERGPVRSMLFAAARRVWDSAGRRVAGATACAQPPESGSAAGMSWTTAAALEAEWRQGRDLPTRETVLWVEEAHMLGLKQLERLAAVADKARSMLVLVGAVSPARSVARGSPFASVLRQIGPVAEDASIGVAWPG